MAVAQWIALLLSGVFAGALAGLLGIGGGTVMVPILLALGYEPIQAVATSSLAIIINSLSGSWQNWRMGYLDPERVLWLGLPAVVMVQLGVLLASSLSPQLLLIAFAILLAVNIFLVGLRKQLASQETPTAESQKVNPKLARVLTGAIAGFMAGLLGVGGGVIMVPLQMLLLGDPIKRAIQTSLGVVVMTAIASTIGHATQGNVIWIAGLILGAGGALSARLSSRTLPKLPDQLVSLLFRGLLVVLILYTLWKAFQYQAT
ncbi:sulfite exporter TauE/SafE family protein [Oscillatoria sp. CS-180]|uniref:sulfite exporter TauE/SafE family protein n=1 Tax=Oscillatoria sp. CS-180 TaxID=3021720 RepID=UPI00232C10DE|nr:sulfite exporter TauE/SafE family protein [Oscillatoria sp. CS-180]MDB9528194.1 sulfite exporter TauE/SafE family protein [Oscillatoria sp. CS-180]